MILDYEESEILFDKIASDNPFMIEYMDYYSNILHVRQKNVKLCELAQRMTRANPYRPETCCCLGILFLLKGIIIV